MTAPVDRAKQGREPGWTARTHFVPGVPAPQGSKRYFGKGAKESSERLPGWRADVRQSLLDRDTGTPVVFFTKDTPVRVDLEFVMPRPARLGKTREESHTKRPDADKLARAVLDAIGSAGVWADDSQVTALNIRKRYAGHGGRSGCWITLVVDE